MQELDLHSLKEYIKDHHLTYYIETYGCQMNVHDSERIAGMLSSLGYKKSDEKSHVDFIIFNTCCVRESAEKKTFGNIGALRKLKERRPDLMIAVCGCMMQQKNVAQKLKKRFPFVNILLGTHNMHEMPTLISRAFSTSSQVLSVRGEEKNIVEGIPVCRGGIPTAYVNIMYGCDNYCSYCIVPFVRGRERSRNADLIIQEVKDLANAGYREVMLLGQNVNSYGLDQRDGIPFYRLLSRLCEETGIRRIRFMTSHPKDISDELIDTIAKFDKICNHLHLPVQSGSDRVLMGMNRNYTRESYLAIIGKLRAKIPGIGLTTDIIVGFPGETEEDFSDTLDLVKSVRFDSAYTFMYSKRTGTKAAGMGGQVDPQVSKDRLKRLITLQQEITYSKNRSHVGSCYEVLVESVSKRNGRYVSGRTQSGRMVSFKGPKCLIGQMVYVTITEAKKNTLSGKMGTPSKQ